MSVQTTPLPANPAEEGILPVQSATLDLLRAMAVSFVVLSHLPIALAYDQEFDTRFLGALGVAIFFVHTCLVLMQSLVRQVSEGDGRAWVISFFLRRIFRIYPLSVTVVTVLAACSWLSLSDRNTFDLSGYLSNVLLIQNITEHLSTPGPLWSLPFEVQMYVLLPPLFVLVLKGGKSAPYVVALLWFAAAALVLGAWALGWNYHLIKYWPCFIPGILAFSLRHRRRVLRPSVLAWYVAAMALAYPYAITHGGTQNLLTWPICLGLGLIIPHCRELDQPVLRWVSQTIAKYSYSIYLLHVPCIQLAFEYLAPLPAGQRWVTFLLSLGALTVGAHHLVEAPGIAWGTRLAERYRLIRWARPTTVHGMPDTTTDSPKLNKVA
jgi:peptidoglycan/LPS O-acetylase OafA/YrhL